MKKILLIILFASQVFATDWYVGATASGSGNASSWANKDDLPTFNWSGVSAGDIVYLDGGTDSLVYTLGSTEITIDCAGSSGNVITITRGLDTGHDGMPRITGTNTNIFILPETSDYITIDGLGFRPVGGSGASTGGQTIQVNGADYLTIQNCDMDSYNKSVRLGYSDGSSCDGVRILYNTMGTKPISTSTGVDGIWLGQNGHDLEVAYNTIKIQTTASNGNHKDIIQSYGWQADGTGTTRIHHNFFFQATAQTTSNSIFELGGIGGNWEIHNNIVVYGGSGSGRVFYMGNCGEAPYDENNFKAKIYNNTFVVCDNSYYGIRVEHCDSLVMKNNLVILSNTLYNTLLMGTSTTLAGYLDIDYNLYDIDNSGNTGSWFNRSNCDVGAYSDDFAYWQSTYGQDAHGSLITTGTNVDFVGASLRSTDPDDFRLEPTSRGVDEGVSLGAGYDQTDYYGNTRTGTWDIGAIEYGASPPPTTRPRRILIGLDNKIIKGSNDKIIGVQ